MNQLLKLNQIVQLDNGENSTVKEFLGSGGQGEVYRIEIQGHSFALKWYFPHQTTTEQRDSIKELIKVGALNGNFLFPLHLVTSTESEGFGYVMPLRPDNYKNISDLMKRRIEPSFRELLTATIQLTDSFLELHAKGLCYRDISFGNFFIDPDTGDILICDNDNVTVNNGSTLTGVIGTPRFMAPEIVCRENNPNSDSDLFSLSVLLFYMLMLHHPLEGKKEADIKCFDLPAMEKLYGTAPLFIFDPDDISNRPVEGYQDNALDNWPNYPQFIQSLFIQSFTKGLKEKDKRVRGGEWRKNLLRLKDSIIDCSCGVQYFYDEEYLKTNGRLENCWSCKKIPILPPRIRIELNTGQIMTVILNTGAELYPYHLYPAKSNKLKPAVAQVVQNPSNPSIWGLKNLTAETWTFSDKGELKTVEHGKSVTLATGITINFGQAQAQIRI
jgi:serine/threonine protein kinase